MKKMISIVLALVLTCALAVTCFAALAANGTGTDSKDVTVSVTAGNDDTKVYGADLVWDAEVAYSYGKTWSTTELKYVDNADGTWTDNAVSVGVKNRSNAELYATVEFTASNAAVTAAEGAQTLTCPAATVGAMGATQTATFTLSGNLVGTANAAVIGSLDVTFSATAPAAQ